MKKRCVSMLLAVVLLVTALVPLLPLAEAAKVEKSRTIAIVFDNSGSMYFEGSGYPDPNYRWCRAIYAMEVFAAMLNEEDTLLIYPMNAVEVDGETYTSYKPLSIHGPDGSEKIRRIVTVDNSTGTPVQAVKDAYEGLSKAKDEEKYLIILTDGDVFHWYDGSQVAANSNQFSQEIAKFSQGVEQMFLAIDADSDSLPKVQNQANQYIQATSSGEILPTLTDMCNRIFGRSELKVSGQNVSFDVSMSKVIVFIQGDDISDVRLSGGQLVSQREMKHCQAGGKHPTASVDTTLQGVLVTYSDLDAGSYQLTYSGKADNVAVYYEPDVDLRIQMVDQSGNDMDPNNVSGGNYKLIYTLVDKYGNPTDSELLRDLNFSMTFKINGKDHTHTDTKSGSMDITLNPTDKVEGDFRVTYLKDYTIRKTGVDLGWLNGQLKVPDLPVGTTTLEVTGGADSYLLSKLEQEALYQVKVFCDGQPVTGSDLSRVELTTEIQNGNARVEKSQTAEGFTVRLKYNGTKDNTQCGDQSIVFTAVVSNRDGIPGDPADATKNFCIEDDSKALAVKLVLGQDEYVISGLDDSAPIIAKLTVGGAPLTQEQFAAATVTVTIDGLQYDLQPDAANSRYLINLKGGPDVKPGEYTVTCHVDGINGLGKPAQAEDTTKIELQRYPLWLRILFWLLVTALVIFLIWTYLNTKVLPKDIRIAPGGNFNVDGEVIPGQISCTYVGKNKKRGTLRIVSPQCMSNPLAKCGFTLELEAISPRRTRSAARSVMVRGIMPMNASTTQNMQIGTRTLAKDPITERLTAVGVAPNSPIDVRIGNNANTMIMAEVMDMNDGQGVGCTLTAKLRFY